MKHYEIKDKEILLVNVEGTIYAIDDRCGHMSASLSMGKLKGKIVECALHHARFDVTTGKKLDDGHLGGAVGAVASKTKMGAFSRIWILSSSLMSSVKFSYPSRSYIHCFGYSINRSIPFFHLSYYPSNFFLIQFLHVY